MISSLNWAKLILAYNPQGVAYSQKSAQPTHGMRGGGRHRFEGIVMCFQRTPPLHAVVTLKKYLGRF